MENEMKDKYLLNYLSEMATRHLTEVKQSLDVVSVGGVLWVMLFVALKSYISQNKNAILRHCFNPESSVLKVMVCNCNQ